MKYFKTIIEDNIVCISTLNEDGKGNITEKEYNNILEMIRKCPPDKILTETKKGFGYIDNPYYLDDPSKGGLDPDHAWKIIESSNISKENKALLKDYIYKEG